MPNKKYSQEKNDLKINLRLDAMDLSLVLILILFILKLFCVCIVGYSKRTITLPSLGTKIKRQPVQV